MKKLILILTAALAGCTTSDKEIKADIAAHARRDLNFAGLNYTVDRGKVNVWGLCPSEKAFALVQQTLGDIHVIKSINYNVVIAPVLLNDLTPRKLQIDSILSSYPKVVATINEQYVTLKGQISDKEKQKLSTALAKQGFQNIQYSLTIETIAE